MQFLSDRLLATVIVPAYAKEESTYSHTNREILRPVAAATPVGSSYRLPLDRNHWDVITNGPYEDDHQTYFNGVYVGSAEAIDLSPRGPYNVYAARSGTVYIKNTYSTWGNLIVIYTAADNLYTYYAHLASFQAGLVVDGTVTQGQSLEIVGQTGNATADHLHFEVRDGMSNRNPSTGNSANHSVRRIRGIGWFPWYPSANANSGFTISADDPHKVGQCRSDEDILIRWPSHSEFVHQDEARWRYDGTLGQKNFSPPLVVNASHTVGGGNYIGNAEIQQQNYFIHVRAYDYTTGVWASDDRVAHQGPYKLGLNCASTSPPNY